ncbi:TetM/TetW/TetO/TetS family tetracycline resistance ribosomal protection protein [Kribbella capetownensis]|uniref:TetM/TetW/TetO/TetS family tetracycline resistance ribosomal protection protein n=1 Tax=Kribbella capetownensis TaxID=1572659 RepID=A0A4R0IU30_9ACTN|nr:TetM/TetW/TetO/TetS family tetracycline resistance ribosomal protection protein [Kribbella capetownensis]TCC36647.1 TetM/TetW/TetO/TetS family tetracycline resistance ribosomal protection protein [Kribbella capetownensis]
MGIVAHVDAGKTSLTERLLYAAGVIDRVGRVDAGDTQTDSMDLERKRGITIRSAVVSFELGDLSVNLIDTPGHSDFIAEVERALSVLDGAVLVISAVEGVQVQTRLLMRTLARLRIPTCLFVNKIDRVGARYDELLADTARLLTTSAVPMGSVQDLGTRAGRFLPFSLQNKGLGELLAERNDEFMARYLDDALSVDDYSAELQRQVAAAQVHPVYFGSAMTGDGVPELIEGIRSWLPRATADSSDDLRARVFKVERGVAGQKIASARVFAGSLSSRAYVDVHPADGPSYQARPTAVDVFEHGSRRSVERAEAGQIVALRGLKEVRIGDQLGVRSSGVGQLFAPPTLETVVSAPDRMRLFQALTQLAEQDPLIRVRKADDLTVSLYGEVQKEVIASLLESEYGLAVTFSQTSPIYIERVDGVGTSYREIGAADNPWTAGVGFRVSPIAEGIDYRLDVELGALPRAFHTAIEETARVTLQQGLSGWEIPNCRIDLTYTDYSSAGTVAADFRRLVPPVLMQAIHDAGTTVMEPINHFELDIPPDSISRVLGHLAESRGLVEHTAPHPGHAHLEGTIPAATTHPFESHLPTLTHGEALLTTTFHTHHPVPTPAPTRPRTDGNPLNHNEYLVHLNRQ